jgi:FKBP12-rapamycin complex-associated protein
MSWGSNWSEALLKIIGELKNKNPEVRFKAAKNFRSFVLSQSREMTGEMFAKFLADLHNQVFELVNGTAISDKIGGILAIDELIDIDYDENATKITRLSNFLRICLSTPDHTVMVMAAKALGRLARTGGTHTAECVEFEVGFVFTRSVVFSNSCACVRACVRSR